jgi:hypothetical protein
MRCGVCDSAEPHPPHYTEEPTVDELVAFLRAALDRDDQVALGASGRKWIPGIEREGSPGRWTGIKAELVTLPANDTVGVGDEVLRAEATSAGRGAILHATRWDPDRVLTEVKAKRERLLWIESELADDETNETARWLLQLDAQPYAGQPGWREEWGA